MQRQTLSTPDGQLSVLDEGRGPTVVLVHGTPSSSFEFRHVIEGLRGRARVVAPDHLGFGQSDKSATADYSVAAHQRRFARVMEELEVRDAIFVLHDFGTAFALPWMLAHPDRVRGVLLANTFAWPVTGSFARIARFYSSRFGRWLYRAANISVGTLLPYAWGKHQPLTPELHARYKAPFANKNERHASAALPGELVGDSLAALEGQIARLAQWPTRAVWGMADPMVGPAELARWKEALPNLPVHEVERAGHFVADEAPEAVLAALTELLDATHVATPTDRPLDAQSTAQLRERAAAATG